MNTGTQTRNPAGNTGGASYLITEVRYRARMNFPINATWDGGGASPTGVGGPKKFLLLFEQKETVATSRSRRRIHPPTKSGAFCVVGKLVYMENC